MKLMIASDLHGDADCTAALLEQFHASGAERLILLGDLLYHGPRNDLPVGYAPKKVISLLNETRDALICVRGNCDTEVDQMVLSFPIMAPYALIPLGERMIFATHGHHFHKDALPPLKKGDVLLHGHTHVPTWDETEEGIFVFNPGSATIPKGGSQRGYMTLEGNEFTWKNLAGDLLYSLSKFCYIKFNFSVIVCADNCLRKHCSSCIHDAYLRGLTSDINTYNVHS